MHGSLLLRPGPFLYHLKTYLFHMIKQCWEGHLENSKNNRGSTIEPRGTPMVTSNSSGRWLLTETDCDLPDR